MECAKQLPSCPGCSTPEPAINAETGEAEEAEPLNEYEAEDLLLDASLYAACGVGLGAGETHRVALALHKLGQDPAKNCASVRFFGKLFGTTANYYVFESTPKGEEEEVRTQLGCLPSREACLEGMNCD